MKISSKKLGEYTVLSISGILNASSAPQFKKYLEESDINGSLLIDLEQVDFLDSSGLGVLVGIARRKKSANEILKLANLNERVKKVFEITQAYTLFDIYDDLDAAAE